MSPEQYRRLRDKEAAEKSKKKFGAYGPQSFKSRSLKSFQTDLEQGKAAHLMPMLDAKKKLAKGQIRQEDIPYMQRLGSWDGSDVGKKKKWTEDDKKYNQNYKPNKLNWQDGFQANKKTAETAKAGGKSPPKKGFFGLF